MILIKGMEMPKGCASCFLKYGSCSSIRKRMGDKGDRWCPQNYRHPDCPLIEVPPHGRLIDADALMNEGWTLHKQTMWMGNCATHVISLDNPNVPTVIPADKDGET